jgi:two-component system, OmpR family, sensor kinase
VAPAGSTITVDVAVAADVVTLRVIDRGPGLSDADKVEATRRFWRADSATEGTGLGLAIVDALVASCGASLSFADTPGGGLTVIVGLRPADASGA